MTSNRCSPRSFDQYYCEVTLHELNFLQNNYFSPNSTYSLTLQHRRKKAHDQVIHLQNLVRNFNDLSKLYVNEKFSFRNKLFISDVMSEAYLPKDRKIAITQICKQPKASTFGNPVLEKERAKNDKPIAFIILELHSLISPNLSGCSRQLVLELFSEDGCVKGSAQITIHYSQLNEKKNRNVNSNRNMRRQSLELTSPSKVKTEMMNRPSQSLEQRQNNNIVDKAVEEETILHRVLENVLAKQDNRHQEYKESFEEEIQSSQTDKSYVINSDAELIANDDNNLPSSSRIIEAIVPYPIENENDIITTQTDDINEIAPIHDDSSPSITEEINAEVLPENGNPSENEAQIIDNQTHYNSSQDEIIASNEGHATSALPESVVGEVLVNELSTEDKQEIKSVELVINDDNKLISYAQTIEEITDHSNEREDDDSNYLTATQTDEVPTTNKDSCTKITHEINAGITKENEIPIANISQNEVVYVDDIQHTKLLSIDEKMATPEDKGVICSPIISADAQSKTSESIEIIEHKAADKISSDLVNCAEHKSEYISEKPLQSSTPPTATTVPATPSVENAQKNRVSILRQRFAAQNNNNNYSNNSNNINNNYSNPVNLSNLPNKQNFKYHQNSSQQQRMMTPSQQTFVPRQYPAATASFPTQELDDDDLSVMTTSTTSTFFTANSACNIAYGNAHLQNHSRYHRATTEHDSDDDSISCASNNAVLSSNANYYPPPASNFNRPAPTVGLISKTLSNFHRVNSGHQLPESSPAPQNPRRPNEVKSLEQLRGTAALNNQGQVLAMRQRFSSATQNTTASTTNYAQSYALQTASKQRLQAVPSWSMDNLQRVDDCSSESSSDDEDRIAKNAQEETRTSTQQEAPSKKLVKRSGSRVMIVRRVTDCDSDDEEDVPVTSDWTAGHLPVASLVMQARPFDSRTRTQRETLIAAVRQSLGRETAPAGRSDSESIDDLCSRLFGNIEFLVFNDIYRDFNLRVTITASDQRPSVHARRRHSSSNSSHGRLVPAPASEHFATEPKVVLDASMRASTTASIRRAHSISGDVYRGESAGDGGADETARHFGVRQGLLRPRSSSILRRRAAEHS